MWGGKMIGEWSKSISICQSLPVEKIERLTRGFVDRGCSPGRWNGCCSGGADLSGGVR